jgi:hypothetical protein
LKAAPIKPKVVVNAELFRAGEENPALKKKGSLNFSF